MMTFKVKFHRYSNGQSRFSAPHWVQAETLFDATKTALHMLSAMKQTDPSSTYIIASVDTDGLRGDDAVSGWYSAEEFSAKVLRDMSDADLSTELDRLEKTPVVPGSPDDRRRNERSTAIKEEIRARNS